MDGNGQGNSSRQPSAEVHARHCPLSLPIARRQRHAHARHDTQRGERLHIKRRKLPQAILQTDGKRTMRIYCCRLLKCIVSTSGRKQNLPSAGRRFYLLPEEDSTSAGRRLYFSRKKTLLHPGSRLYFSWKKTLLAKGTRQEALTAIINGMKRLCVSSSQESSCEVGNIAETLRHCNESQGIITSRQKR